VFASFLRQDVSFFDDDRHTSGALTAKLSEDAQMIQGISGSALGTIVQFVSTLLGGIIVALIYGWKLGLTATAVLPLLVGSAYWRNRIITYYSEINQETYQKSAQRASEAVASIRTVQSLTREKDIVEKYTEMLQEPLNNGVKMAWSSTVLYAVSQSVNFLVNALIFWYGGRLIAYEGYDLKQFFTVFVAIVFGSMGAGRIFAFAPDMSKAMQAGASVIEILGMKPFIDYLSTDGKKLDKVDGEIEFKDVRFNYPTRPHVQVLQGLNLKVKPGQFAAFVGASGCGKSTTIGLLTRFYDPSSGNILIDGHRLSGLNLSNYRSFVGLVSQEPNLFDMTIKENILLGCDGKNITQEDIERACKEANIHDFIMSLPEKYETRLGGRGGQLSGGQKQRIAIARALIRNPRILLLDEATSALDAESEKVVQAALDAAAQGRTTISIAHRLSTIQNADIIFVFKDGVVHEQGTHQELLALKGVYNELVAQQNLDRSRAPTQVAA
jgi:ATP-binding cassette subfamily B (MDR/TAP) protein 1